MNLTQEILFFLSNHPGNYKKLRQRLAGSLYLSDLEESKSHKKFYDTFYHLKRRGLIECDGKIWRTSQKYRDKSKALIRFRKKNFKPAKESRGNLLIMFDIPEQKRRDREWLRRKLKQLNFVMIQQSIWLGPAPLPKDFAQALKELGILNYLKFFDVKEKSLI